MKKLFKLKQPNQQSLISESYQGQPEGMFDSVAINKQGFLLYL